MLRPQPALLALALAWAGSCQARSCSTLPVVDLGYERHQALSYNATTDLYEFANVRYARDPTGDLRFRAPQPPVQNRSVIQTGDVPKTCPQGIPPWQLKVFVPLGEFSAEPTFNLSAWEDTLENATAPPIPVNPASSEDCLFLDVFVPGDIMKKAQDDKFEGAPVLVWIHGGGYVFGSKSGSPTPNYGPIGLLQHAVEHEKSGMVYVALNYRLGAFGFMGGDEVEADGDLNAGLLDQRFALDWVQKNIHLFGGSPKKVTVMGESGGGSSILTHMTGPSVPAPFQQAITQSPAVYPLLVDLPTVYSDFFSRLNVTTLKEARAAPETDLIAANEAQIGAAPDNTFVWGSVKDKAFPEHHDTLLRSGDFDKSVTVLASHTSLEGGFFFDPSVKTEAEFKAWLPRTLAGLSKAQKNHLTTNIYPPVFDGSHGYVDQGSRQMALMGDGLVDCNFLAVNEAFDGKSYAYEFTIAPGIHTQDLGYEFDSATPPFVPEAQQTIRSAITSFVVGGVPLLRTPEHVKGVPFPHWDSDQTVIKIGETGSKRGKDSVSQSRCDWWYRAME